MNKDKAGVAELVYALALGASSRKGLRVQISPPAPVLEKNKVLSYNHLVSAKVADDRSQLMQGKGDNHGNETVRCHHQD